MANKICVYAICKNEEDNVEKWVNSLSSADIICVTDDGSTDNTISFLRDSKDSRINIWTQSWPDDYFSFGEARNIARAHAQEIIDKIREPEDEWILVNLDFDQFVRTKSLESLKESWYKGCLGAIVTECFLGNPDNTFSHYYKVQNEDLRWHWYGDIHEYLSHSENPKPYDVYNEDLLDLRNTFIYDHFPRERNAIYYEIGEKALANDPNNSYLLSCLVDSAVESGYKDSCIKYCTKLLNFCFNDSSDLFYQNYTMAATWYMYLIVADPENTEYYYAQILQLIQEDKIKPYRRLYVEYGDYLFDKDPDQAVSLYKKALSLDWKDPSYPYIVNDYYMYREDWRVFFKLMMLYFYKKQNYQIALYYAAQAVADNPNDFNMNNLKSCILAYETENNI